jgi:NAD(P)-dependent dehydrogenase (short-subunit alcohol dehydrogenase family)
LPGRGERVVAEQVGHSCPADGPLGDRAAQGALDVVLRVGEGHPRHDEAADQRRHDLGDIAVELRPVDLFASLAHRFLSCPPMEVRGAAAIVTGGASGLGEATVRHLARAGAEVTILDFNAEKGEALAAELGTRFVRCDVTDAEQVAESVVAATEGAPLRIAVNCAGTGTAVRTIGKDGSPHIRSEWDRVVNINLLGTFVCLTHEASLIARTEPLADGQRGVIINTASVAAFDGQIGQLAYAASKGGVVAMTLPAARDLSVVGIRVCTIAPGLMDTPLLGMLPDEAKKSLGDSVVYPKRLGSPDEFAKLALAIVDNDYLNGEVVRLDGAIRMQPK